MKATKKLVGIVMCAAALVVAVSPVSANLLTNPGFETGDLTGWLALNTSGNAVITVESPDNGPSAPGTHNAFLNNQAEALGLTLKQSTAPGSATAGTVFYSFDLKLGQAALGGVFFVEIFAENAANAVIGRAPLLGNFTPANWTTISGSFVAPPNTDHLTIQFEAVTGAVIGSNSSMHVDNVDLNQGVVPVAPVSWGQLKAGYSRGPTE